MVTHHTAEDKYMKNMFVVMIYLDLWLKNNFHDLINQVLQQLMRT